MSGGDLELSIVIPCLNETATLAQAIELAREAIARSGLRGEVVVADNGSDDGSQALAERLGARVVPVPRRGYGFALMEGCRQARGAYLIMGDADATYDFREAVAFLDDLKRGADLVMGSRLRGTIHPGAMPFLHRYVGTPVLSRLIRGFFRVPISDCNCGLRAFTKAAFDRLQLVSGGMEFASEMIIKAGIYGLKVTERPCSLLPDRRGKPPHLRRWRDGWRHLRFMWLHSPSWALLVPGCLTWLIGLAVALPLAFGPVRWHGRAIDTHCMIMGGLLNTVSIQLITMGLLAKAFAHLSGLRYDRTIAWLYQHISFERFILLALPVILGGALATLRVVYVWVSGGFGPLNEIRLLFLGMLCIVNGTQAAAAGYLFSILALPRHLEPFKPRNGR